MPSVLEEGYARYKIMLDGTEISKDLLSRVREIYVDQNLMLPDALMIRLMDIGTGQSSSDPIALGVTDADVLSIGKELQIWLGQQSADVQNSDMQKLFEGEVTAHEVDMQRADAPMLVIRAYDRSHRLQRGRHSRTFTNQKDSDIAKKIGKDAGLDDVVVDETTQVYAYILQNNQTDFDFLQWRAKRIGYQCFVWEKTLYFVDANVGGSPVSEVQLWHDLNHVHLRMTSSGQMAAAHVFGWDPEQKQPLLGANGQTGQPFASGGQIKSGKDLITQFGKAAEAQLNVSTRPIHSQAEADDMAQSVLDHQASTAMVLEAEIFGDPGIYPSQVVTISKMSKRFDGEYYVTACRHRISRDSTYITKITVAGNRDNTLKNLSATGSGATGRGADTAVTIGLVTNNQDDKKMGRVKVKFPYLGKDPDQNDIESDWARVIFPGSGTGNGMCWLPEVNDEVLVAFLLGDPHFPVVLGGLFNGKDAPSKDGDKEHVGGDGKVNQRVLKSRSGHIMTLDDTDGSEQIRIVDKSGNNKIVYDTTSNKITIAADGDIEINAKQNVKITAGQNFSVEAQQDVSMSATSGSATVKSMTSATVQSQTADANLKGMTAVSVEAETGQASMKGLTTSVNGDTMVQIQGAMVQIN